MNHSSYTDAQSMLVASFAGVFSALVPDDWMSWLGKLVFSVLVAVISGTVSVLVRKLWTKLLGGDK